VKVFITAIGSYLGGALASHLGARGHLVTGSTRRELELGKTFDAAIFAGNDAVIHCAHHFTPGARDINCKSTRSWMEAAAASGVRQQIYLSSHAARPDVESEYGQTKFAIEQLFLEAGYAVVRPGLVAGNGGLYARQRRVLQRMPVVPMLGGGRHPVATLSLDDFLRAVTTLLEEDRRGGFNLFDEPMPTYRAFVAAMRPGKRTIFLPVSIRLAMGLAQFVAWTRLPIPVRPAQIRTLLANESSPWRSDLAKLLSSAR
jgi:nucleoside-diphosphate-sugar epimerase